MQDLYRFHGKNVLYIARVHDTIPLYKYGTTHNLYKKLEKKNAYPAFNLEYVKAVRSREIIEQLFTHELVYRKLYATHVFEGKKEGKLIMLPFGNNINLTDITHIIDDISKFADDKLNLNEFMFDSFEE